MTTPTQEVERTYDVALSGDLIIRGVRLRYEPGTEPADRTGNEARKHAARRAATLAKRRGHPGNFDLDDAGVVALRESLVPAREVTTRDLTTLERKFAKPTPKKGRSKAKPSNNGWA